MRFATTFILLLGLFACTDVRAQTAAWEAKDDSDDTVLQLNTDAGLVVYGAAGVGMIPASGAGVRTMWFPGQWAFRAGRVWSFGATYWDLSNIGQGSAAFGENTRASGSNSFAVNLATTASGDNAVALGNNGTATGAGSIAFNGTASAAGAIALGSGAQAVFEDAISFGPSSIASGINSIALGPSITTAIRAVAIGLQNSANGGNTFVIGKNARGNGRNGGVVFGDGCAGFSSDSVYAVAPNQFVARGCGGIKLFTNREMTAGMELAAGGSGWSAVSDRNRKEHFAAVDGEDVLARLRRVPVSTWNYKSQSASLRHMGPMAQDFHAAFGLGEDSLRINTLDIDGVILAGIQALERRTADLRAATADLRAELSALRVGLAGYDAGLASAQAEASALRSQQSADRSALEARLARLEAALPQRSDPAPGTR